jgi:hypothetical protein
VSSSNGNAMKIGRDPFSSLNHYADYYKVPIAVVASSGRGGGGSRERGQEEKN